MSAARVTSRLAAASATAVGTMRTFAGEGPANYTEAGRKQPAALPAFFLHLLEPELGRSRHGGVGVAGDHLAQGFARLGVSGELVLRVADLEQRIGHLGALRILAHHFSELIEGGAKIARDVRRFADPVLGVAAEPTLRVARHELAEASRRLLVKSLLHQREGGVVLLLLRGRRRRLRRRRGGNRRW